ncbi:hypothetical protein BC833DRAFT_570837, partial [Globomyces pollinis-pini]
MTAKYFVRLFVESNQQCIARLKKVFKREYEADELHVVNEFISQGAIKAPCKDTHQILYSHTWYGLRLRDTLRVRVTQCNTIAEAWNLLKPPVDTLTQETITREFINNKFSSHIPQAFADLETFRCKLKSQF